MSQPSGSLNKASPSSPNPPQAPCRKEAVKVTLVFPAGRFECVEFQELEGEETRGKTNALKRPWSFVWRVHRCAGRAPCDAHLQSIGSKLSCSSLLLFVMVFFQNARSAYP
ncbi:hypothetical protein HGRIS_001000 [Hohenbuehelia grisea]|uniref:Uncharacterized protein n=1 Tax=Hohenbuehelia grisea TaxID=104357 RepID=A0ABR3IQG3_9AGAR